MEQKTSEPSEPSEFSRIPQEELLIRRISVYFLRLFAFLLIYLFISINVGSISQPFLRTPAFSIRFSLSLLCFAVLSNFFGWLIGAIGGFMGELLYQLSTFSDYTFYLEWCIIVGVMGLLFGIYSYKPLKYKERIKTFDNILSFLISAFILMIVATLLTFSTSGIGIESVLVDIGLNLLLQIIISVVFIVPIIVLISDKLFSTNERGFYNPLLTHHLPSEADHTFFIRFGRYRVYFCSRCSGMIISLTFTAFLVYLYENISGTPIGSDFAVFMCILLPIPGMIDWCTQKLKFRTSNTNLRLITGSLIGGALYLLSFTRDFIFGMTIVIIIYFSIFFTVFFVGNRMEIRASYLDE